MPSLAIEKPSNRPDVKPSCETLVTPKLEPNWVDPVKSSAMACGLVAPVVIGTLSVKGSVVVAVSIVPALVKFIVPIGAPALSGTPSLSPKACHVFAAVFMK